jgi:hypothetical protein
MQVRAENGTITWLWAGTARWTFRERGTGGASQYRVPVVVSYSSETTFSFILNQELLVHSEFLAELTAPGPHEEPYSSRARASPPKARNLPLEVAGTWFLAKGAINHSPEGSC